MIEEPESEPTSARLARAVAGLPVDTFAPFTTRE